MYEIVQRFVTPGKGIRVPKFDNNKRQITSIDPQGMFWHWTANRARGAGALNHLRFWERTTVGTHYVIDSQMIAQAMPDTEMAWHVGTSSENASIRRKYPRSVNRSTISAELCVNSDGDWNETYKRAVYLGAIKCIEYGWSSYIHFDRHFDASGKDCPRMWTSFEPGGEAAWDKFKDDVNTLMKVVNTVSNITNIFADVRAGEWYVPELQKAFDRKLFSGMRQSDGRMVVGVGQPVTTERMLVFLNRAIDAAIAETLTRINSK